jgi:predicted CopG family antitoxin
MQSVKTFLDDFKRQNIEKYKKNTELLDEYFISKSGADAQKKEIEFLKCIFTTQELKNWLKIAGL